MSIFASFRAAIKQVTERVINLTESITSRRIGYALGAAMAAVTVAPHTGFAQNNSTYAEKDLNPYVSQYGAGRLSAEQVKTAVAYWQQKAAAAGVVLDPAYAEKLGVYVSQYGADQLTPEQVIVFASRYGLEKLGDKKIQDTATYWQRKAAASNAGTGNAARDNRQPYASQANLSNARGGSTLAPQAPATVPAPVVDTQVLPPPSANPEDMNAWAFAHLSQNQTPPAPQAGVTAQFGNSVNLDPNAKPATQANGAATAYKADAADAPKTYGEKLDEHAIKWGPEGFTAEQNKILADFRAAKEIIGDIRGALCGLALRWPEFDLGILPRIERSNEHAPKIGVFFRTAVRRVERQIDMERMRPKIVYEIEAELADPPERHILGVVGEADRSR